MSTLEISNRDRSIAFLIFGFLLACYLFTYTGEIQSSDGLAMFATVESIVRRGELDINQLLWMDLQQGSYGPDGELYSRKGLGMPILALPLVWLANLWPSIGLVQTALLLNPLLTAWTGGLIYRAGRRLAWTQAAAIITALVFGLATLAWPYTQTFFSDPVSAWGLFSAFYGMLGYRQTGRKRYLLLAGLAWGLAYLSRVVNLVTLPLYIVLLVTVIVRSVKRSLWPGFFSNLRSLIYYNWRAFISFLLPVVAAGLASLWWNWARYGDIWESGYVESERFSAEWLFGIVGLLVGPARGLLWYSPVLLLAVWGIGWYWRQKRWIFLTFLALSLIYVLLYGKWYMWHGGFAWGPRFMVVLLPFLTLMAGPAIEYVLRSRQNSLRLVVWLLVVLSVGIQWLGMLAPFGLVQDWLAAEVQPLFATETFTSLRYSPLVQQWRFLSAEAIPFAWWQAVAPGTIDWFACMIAGVSVVAGAVLITRQLQAVRVQPEHGASVERVPDLADDDATSNLRDSGSFSRMKTELPANRLDQGGVEIVIATEGPRYWLYGGALLILTLALLTRYHATLVDPVMAAAARRIESEAEADDAILHLDPPQTQSFSNQFHGSLPTYGLFNSQQLTTRDREWLTHLRQNYGRIWVIAPPGLPESSGWERALRGDEFLLDPGVSEEFGDRRIPLFGLTAAHQLVDHGVGAIFAAPGTEEPSRDNGLIMLEGYALASEVKAGEELLLLLRWESLDLVDYNYHVFVHLLAPDNELIAQRDGQPVQWLRPVSTWEPGEVIADRYGLLLPETLGPGTYQINIGLYDPLTGERLPVNTGTVESAVELKPFEVQSK